MYKECELCDSKFEINPNLKRSRNKRFCTIQCARRFNGLSNSGRKHTDEWKKMMSEMNSGSNNPFYGKNHGQITKDKISSNNKWDETKYRYCNLTEREMEIFDGIMISDGSLSKSRISGRLTLGFKYLETLNRIIEDLPSLNFSDPYSYEYTDKRTGNTYINFFTKSNFYRDLLYQYKRWYNNSKKIIPDDFIISPLSMYWFYVCDGYLSDTVYLCTDSFEKNEIQLLCDKLINMDFDCSCNSRNRIRFTKSSSELFLDFISDNIKIQEEYKYKWKN